MWIQTSRIFYRPVLQQRNLGQLLGICGYYCGWERVAAESSNISSLQPGGTPLSAVLREGPELAGAVLKGNKQGGCPYQSPVPLPTPPPTSALFLFTVLDQEDFWRGQKCLAFDSSFKKGQSFLLISSQNPS